MTATPKIRCAIYTRKSSEEGLDQDFNSLDAQHEACVAYVASQKHEGWKMSPARYDDGGKSGGTLKRPALQTLLSDLEAGAIDMVVVYKIDRLTRSLADFAKLVERLEEARCSFVSVTQAFNTSSSMGRLTLNVLLSFAQFEREVTAERIRDKIAASKKKGLWMGGVPPLGYDAHPDKTRRELVLNDREAVTVKRVFDLYDQLGGLNAVTQQAHQEDLRSKHHCFSSGRQQGGRHFGRGQIYHILRNPTYLGRIRHKDKSFPGKHVAAIDQALWDRVQARLEASAMRRRGIKSAATRTSHVDAAPLLGKFRDETGDILTPSHTKKGNRRHYYYVSNRLISGQPDPSGWRLPARALEAATLQTVVAHLRRAADRHEVVLAAEAPEVRASADAMSALAEKVDRGGVTHVAALIETGSIGKGCMSITLSATNLASELGYASSDLVPSLFDIKSPLHCRRRGGEMKIIVGDRQPQPDKTLVRALRHAHKWVMQMKKGASIKQIASAASMSESYITRVIPMAFLSPRIQQSIMTGTQPLPLTLETLVRRRIPMRWQTQERLFGFEGNTYP